MARSARDVRRDTLRKPEAVMRFAQLSPGMRVLDIFSGGGYYTELFARVVGPDGEVVSHTNAAYERLLQRETLGRYDDDRLPNVTRLIVEAADLSLADASFHRIFLNLTYHDFFHRSEHWSGVDETVLLAKLKRALRPGGRIVLIDHAARSGRGVEDADQLHRIEEARVIADFQAAGFTLVDRLDVLRNPDDDRRLSAFDPEVRGRTDRFVLMFARADDPEI